LTPSDPHDDDIRLRPVAVVRSELTDLAAAPRQGDEGAPGAMVEFDAAYAEAMGDLRAGDEVLLLAWLDRGDREAQVVHPRGDASRPATGVFSTRSPDRPNPIGLHRVRIEEVDGLRVRVSGLEAIDGTPIVDVKPVLSGDAAER
jgi:tRNA-Thr(GGU) m(6)t(6)A37 methyltransferase TsaA